MTNIGIVLKYKLTIPWDNLLSNSITLIIANHMERIMLLYSLDQQSSKPKNDSTYEESIQL